MSYLGIGAYCTSVLLHSVPISNNLSRHVLVSGWNSNEIGAEFLCYMICYSYSNCSILCNHHQLRGQVGNNMITNRFPEIITRQNNHFSVFSNLLGHL